MTQQTTFSVENNFTKGLITESTGLNFPENAATDTDNCEYTLIGNVLRREGIDFEDNFALSNLSSRVGNAISTYKWNNAGGDGTTQVEVVQNGGMLFFFSVTAATVASPLSAHKLVSTIDLTAFAVSGSTLDTSIEAQFADGNGYLFVFHAGCDPLYCSYNAGTITPTIITVNIRDFTGFTEAISVTTRPSTLSAEHKYNITNQGWTSGSPWYATSNTSVVVASSGSFAFTTAAGLSVTNGDIVQIIIEDNSVPGGIGTLIMSGTVTSYVSTTLTISVFSSYTPANGFTGANWVIQPTNAGYINTWFTAEGNYPSNADVWWYFKNTSGVFDPATTQPKITLASSNAPQGHYVLSAFNQNKTLTSGIAGLTSTVTLKRPSTGAWFQGRVWYAGVADSQQMTGDAPFYTWSENIYFSQINVGTANNFGNCFQQNDPTSEQLFDLLPTDGGVIQIQGSGLVYKLFPTQNGMLVFAANGVWFITGSQGIGFSANDYTITKLSNIETLSAHSFVDVFGLPYFWNEEGIYAVEQQKQGGLAVNPITVGTILTFYNAIPKQSKRYARGAYHPIDYTIQWIYKSANEASVTDRYSYDKILNYNVYNKAFFPYSISISNATSTSINSITYIQGPGGSTSPDPSFKYLSSLITGGNYNFTFSDEGDETLVDWASSTSTNYISFFVTGYKLRGQAIKKFQPQYVQTWSKVTDTPYSGYTIQSIWDYAATRNSGRWSAKQKVQVINNTRFNMYKRRHKLRGSGQAVQFKITSVDGIPFDIAGWAIYDTVNVGV